MKKIKSILKNILHKFGKKFGDKVVVFESDDWGAGKTENISQIYKIFKDTNFVNVYQKYDCLEKPEDLKDLFEVLNKYEDKNGKKAVFTMNYVLKNIYYSKTNKYTTENIDETYKRLYNENLIEKILNNYKEVYRPQLHSLYHFAMDSFNRDIESDKKMKQAFECGNIGFGKGTYQNLDAYNRCKNNEYCSQFSESIKLFNEIFGYASLSTIFPCYVWDERLENIAKQNNIKYIQGNLFQSIPANEKKYKKKFHCMGLRNKHKQIYFYRNCHFEPVKFFDKNIPETECINDIIKQISSAFKNKKPAIICSHRVNYVGGINKSCKEYSLKCLDKVLELIKQKYPDVIFLSSDRLGMEYENRFYKD